MHTAVQTDEMLMARLSAGDLDAAAPLFRRYQKPMFNFFCRLGFLSSESDDLVQTVFERMIRYRETYQPTLSFRTWIYRIARNVRSDFHQKNHNRLVFKPEYDFSAFENSPEKNFEEQETLAQLDTALKTLPEDQLEILLLTRFQGLRYAEVGQLFGCSEGAVKVKVFRAMQQLRTVFFRLEAV